VAALIADFVTMLAISVYVVLRTSGLSPDVLLVLVLLGVGLAVYQVAGVVRHRPSAKWITSLASATSQVPTRGALTLALMFIALAESLGVETILGAFIAGAIVALLAGGHSVDLVHKLDTLGYAFFVPIFFINVGATFDLPALLEQRSALLLVPLLLVIAYLVKIVPGMVFSVAFGKRAAFALGLLTSSRLSLVIAASAIGLQIGAITSATNAAIILVAIVTCTVSPLLFSRFAPIKSEERDGVLIVGESTMALLLVQRLRSQGIHTEHISASTLEAANRELSAFGGDTVAALAALTSDDEYNLQVCQAAQSHGIPSIVAQVQSVQYNELFHAAGARPINPVLATASVFEGLLTHPSVLELLTDHDDHVIMSEIVLTNPSLNGKPLREIYLPQDTLIVMISRGEDRVIARGNTRVAAGDVLTVAGSAAGLEQTQRMLQT
ncbi:MAG TPA: cation:proton antiporter, partial [Roseiflexaceae bacterium]|nr:cation:proton antiporter [Roseiflexaceae bacterium]